MEKGGFMNLNGVMSGVILFTQFQSNDFAAIERGANCQNFKRFFRLLGGVWGSLIFVKACLLFAFCSVISVKTPNYRAWLAVIGWLWGVVWVVGFCCRSPRGGGGWLNCGGRVVVESCWLARGSWCGDGGVGWFSGRCG